ncbi:MAG TPA: hypothetical protein H9692_05135, partial [Firmicutes bacterium]|nr:hypothetical protein [Bacillota bacterium]
AAFIAPISARRQGDKQKLKRRYFVYFPFSLARAAFHAQNFSRRFHRAAFHAPFAITANGAQVLQ